MIDKKRIINLAVKTGIEPETLEKDYAMNLILDALARCSSTQNSFYFKGGCCVHKCFTFFNEGPYQGKLDPYFIYGRFSSDIDMTVSKEMMNTEKLHEVFTDVASYLKEVHGLIINQFDFPIHQQKTKDNCRGFIHFEGPLFAKGKPFNSPKLKFDLTADEHMTFEPFVRPIYHPYSNMGEEILLVSNTYTLRDIFAEKIRACCDRCSPRDIYDLHVLMHHPDLDDVRQIGIGLSIIEKFKFKNLELDLSMERFDRIIGKNGLTLKQNCEIGWGKNLTHQLPKSAREIVTFENYWNQGRLPEIFSFANHCVQLAKGYIERMLRVNPHLDYNKALDEALLRNRRDPGVSHFRRALDRLPVISPSQVHEYF